MATSYEIDEPLTEVESVLLEQLLSHKTYRKRTVSNEHSTPADRIHAAAELFQEAFAQIDADAIRSTPAGDPTGGSTTTDAPMPDARCPPGRH